jgi:CBS domain-containing protein
LSIFPAKADGARPLTVLSLRSALVLALRLLMTRRPHTVGVVTAQEAAMTVGDICSRNVVVAPQGEMIIDAAKRMRTSHVGALVVVETKNGRHVPIGIITDRDIVLSVVASDPEHLHALLVGDVMGVDLITAREHETVDAALKKMHAHGVRRLPIVDGAGTLVGILTLDDVLRYVTAQQSELVALVAQEQQHERQYRV